MALLFEAGCRVGLLGLNVLEVLSLHVREGLILEQHVVHELIPLDSAARICINLHEQLVELLVRHLLANNILKTHHKLHKHTWS